MGDKAVDKMTSHLNVSAQWDVSSTAFSTYELLKGLIGASSKDEVHPQAVLAAEALGSGLIVAKERIGEAIDSLGGQDSIRVSAFKANIGLMRGATQAIIRQSTPLCQFYIFCAACKLIYLDQEIGDFAFLMMSKLNLLANHPVSSSQLGRLISHLSGHAMRLSPVEYMHEVAVLQAQHQRNPHVYSRMDSSSAVGILLCIFQNMCDLDIHCMVLKGSESGVWLSAALLWMFGDDAALSIDRNLVKGRHNARLLIELDQRPEWHLSIWKNVNDATASVIQGQVNVDKRRLNIMPISSICSLIETWFNTSNDTADRDRQDFVQVTGALAGAYVKLLVEDGLIKSRCIFPGDDHKADWCRKTSIPQIANVEWNQKCGQIILNYGWSVRHLKEQEQLFDRLQKYTASEERYEDASIRRLPGNFNVLSRLLITFCEQYIFEKLGLQGEQATDIWKSAMAVAVDAILTCTAIIKTPIRFVNPETFFDWSTFVEPVLIGLLGPGVKPDRFQNLTLQTLLAMPTSVDDRCLVQTSNGMVAGPTILWTHSIAQSDSLSVTLLNGRIESEGVQYESIREWAPKFYSKDDILYCPQVKFKTPDSSSLCGSALSPSFSMAALESPAGDHLEIRQYLEQSYTCKDLEMNHYAIVSWQEAIANLATVHHVADLGYPSPAVERENCRQLRALLDNNSVRWILPSLIDMQGSCMRYVVDCENSNLAKMFSIDSVLQRAFNDRCCQVNIRQSGSLVQNILLAEKRGAPWILIN